MSRDFDRAIAQAFGHMQGIGQRHVVHTFSQTHLLLRHTQYK